MPSHYVNAMTIYCKLDRQKQKSVKFESKYEYIISRKFKKKSSVKSETAIVASDKTPQPQIAIASPSPENKGEKLVLPSFSSNNYRLPSEVCLNTMFCIAF